MSEMVELKQDDALEAAIDAVGRDRVYAAGKAYGWGPYDWPPKWVWWGIVRELEDRASVERSTGISDAMRGTTMIDAANERGGKSG